MRRISLSEIKKQELEQKLAEGFGDDADSQHMLSDLILLMVEKTLQEILKAEQSEVLGHERYEHGEQATTVPNVLQAEAVCITQLSQVTRIQAARESDRRSKVQRLD